MRIIKVGKELAPDIRFTCHRCGCVFEEETSECLVSFTNTYDKLYSVNCPCCNLLCCKTEYIDETTQK